MYNVIIIDDERLSRLELKRILKSQTKLIIHEASTYEEAINMIEEVKPELIFLDIQLNGKKTGFDVLENISHTPQVIFTTAFDEFAIKAFETNAIDYIMKPMESDRVNEGLTKAFKIIEAIKPNTVNMHLLTMDNHVFVKDNNNCWFVKIKDIILLERDQNYTRIFFETFKPLVLKSLNQLEDRLDEKHFFRANRKQVINVNKIEQVQLTFSNCYLVTLQNDVKVELSRRQSVKFKDVMSF